MISVVMGILCVVGELALSYELNVFQEQHQEIMAVYVENREYMANIKTKLYEHHSLLINHVLSNNPQVKADYEEQEAELRKELSDLIVEFSYRMKGGEREQTYHKVYSDFASYNRNADAIINFSNAKDKAMAIYYNDTVLKPFLSDIDANLEDLDTMTMQDIENAENKIQETVELSRKQQIAIVAIAVIIVVICTCSSVKITSDLERYKINLENEIIEKNRVLQERSENMIRLQDGVIIAMANLIESRDGETGEHVKRTSKYVELIANKARESGVYADVLTDEYIERLVKVAPLHDVGKISVPDHILMKPGKLTAEEFEEIKRHVTFGGEIIREFFENIEDQVYVEMAADVATYHHERWNGEGYMQHLAGEDIPLAARIMSLADAFDALISKRRYKEDFSLDRAFEIVKESSGTQFDPKLAEVFLTLRPQIEEFLEHC